MNLYKELALPQTISDILRARDLCIEHLGTAYKAHELAASAASSILRYAMPCESQPEYSFERARKEIDKRIWRSAFSVAGFGEIWDAKAASEFEKSLEKDTPEFTEANIRATFLELLPQQEMMFKRGVVRVFRGLSSSYRSNDDKFSIGPRMVLGSWTQPSWTRGRQVNYHAQDAVRDMFRVICKLSDRPFNDREVIGAINTAWMDGEYADPYIRMVPFKNGNAHVYIADQMRQRINGVISEYYDGRALAEPGRQAA